MENGATLTTYLFRYTSECTISWSNFQNFLRLSRQGALTPLTKILQTFLDANRSVDAICAVRSIIDTAYII